MKENLFIRLVRVSDFLKIWSSQIFSQVSFNLINFVVVLKIFEATGSTVAISLVWIFMIVPVVILGPFSGAIVDLVERRKILLLTNLSQSVIILFYLLVGTKMWPIYGIVFLYSLTNQLYLPAEAATLPRVVPRKLLPAANSFFLFTVYGAILAGFGLAGPLLRLLGREVLFIMGSFFLFCAAVAVYFLPTLKQKVKNNIKGPQEFWGQVKEGYLFIRRKPTVFFPLMLMVFAQVIITPLILLTPSYATEVLHLNLLDVGPAFVLPFGLGAILGVQGVIWALRRTRKKKIINFALLGASLWLVVLSLVIPHLSSWRLPLAILGIFFLGMCYVSFLVPSQTLIQEKTPEEFRGRVFGALGFLINLVSILPILLGASIADLLGATWTMFIIAVVIGIVWFYSLREPYSYANFNSQ